VAVQIGGLQSGDSQFLGSWHGYLNLSSQPVSKTSRTDRLKIKRILIFLSPSVSVQYVAQSFLASPRLASCRSLP
jgi:hypothetical protein